MVLLKKNLHLKWVVIYAFFLPITTILYLGIPSFQITQIHSLVRFVDYLVFLAAFYEIIHTDLKKNGFWIIPAVAVIFLSAVFLPSYGYWYFIPRLFYPAISVYLLYAFCQRHILLISFCIFSLLEAVGDLMLLVWKLTKLDVYNLQVTVVLWNSTLLSLMLLFSVFYRRIPKTKIRKN